MTPVAARGGNTPRVCCVHARGLCAECATRPVSALRLERSAAVPPDEKYPWWATACKAAHYLDSKDALRDARAPHKLVARRQRQLPLGQLWRRAEATLAGVWRPGTAIRRVAQPRASGLPQLGCRLCNAADHHQRVHEPYEELRRQRTHAARREREHARLVGRDGAALEARRAEDEDSALDGTRRDALAGGGDDEEGVG